MRAQIPSPATGATGANGRILPGIRPLPWRASRGAMLAGLLAALFLVPSGLRADGPDIARELDCLALNIYWEAAFEPEAGKYGVAHVTINRRDDSRWPDTVCGVVYESRAFSWTITHPDRRPENNEAWEQARAVANRVFFGLDDGQSLWRAVTYYHADYVREGIRTSWQSRLVEYVQVGRHIFYRPAYDRGSS